jgi:glycosyltransferase involved in cell wall biosynthesis
MVHIVVDAVAVRSGSSAIVLEHLLGAWRSLAADDRITVLTGSDGPGFPLPDGVDVHRLSSRLPGPAAGLWLRSVAVRRAAARLGADAVLSGVPASGLVGTGSPRGIILYDLRHELRPHQFSRGTRIARRVSWWWSMRQADGIYTISERTLHDLQARHPRLATKARAAVLGADHVDAWPTAVRAEPPYALAFGHFANKNADAVVEGWARFCATDDTWRLRLVGMGSADRASATELVRRLGVEDRVELMPWLDDDEFQACFAAAGLVVFPSDFEGYGLPAVEAMRLGIPVVVSDDEALAEVTGGHAVVAASTSAADLAAAIAAALRLTGEHLEAGRAHTDTLTWRRTAQVVRDSLLAASRSEIVGTLLDS